MYPCDLVDKRIKEFLDKILAPKTIAGTLSKKDLVIALSYLGKLSPQIHIRINCIMNNKIPYCNIRFLLQTKCKINNFLHLKTKFLRSYVLVLLRNFSVLVATLPIMSNLNVILRSECVNTREFRHSLEKELKVMMILELKNILYFAIAQLISKISQLSLPTTMTLMLP